MRAIRRLVDRGAAQVCIRPAVTRFNMASLGAFPHLSIAPHGDVYPCQCLHAPDLRAGSLCRSRLADIWARSAVLRGLRRHDPPRFAACDACAIASSAP